MTGPVEAGWVTVIDPEAWALDTATEDPLEGHRQGSVLCSTAAYYPELGGVEMDTNTCNYLSLSQPLLEDLPRGAALKIVAWWNSLVSVEPVQAHLALLLDGRIFWEERIEVPGEADARQVVETLPFDVAKGRPITVHLHNHGYNTWQLNQVLLERAE